jgi:hypothetical protein
MTGMPIVAPVAMGPMTGNPNPSRMRRLSPVTPDRYISPVPCFPLFVDPDVTRAGGNRSFDRMPDWANRDIDLSGSGVGEGTYTDHQHCHKGQFYNFTLHMLVFKFLIGHEILSKVKTLKVK